MPYKLIFCGHKYLGRIQLIWYITGLGSVWEKPEELSTVVTQDKKFWSVGAACESDKENYQWPIGHPAPTEKATWSYSAS